MNKTIKLLLFLGIISALSGLCIGFVNGFAEPIIEANDAKVLQASLNEIFPDCTFETLEVNDDSGYIDNVYKASNGGYIIETSGIGYNASSPISILIGFDETGKIVSIQTLSQQETNGYGSRCFEDSTIESAYLNRTLDEEVDMVSKATFTSTAMKNMISAAQSLVKELI